MSLLKKLKDTAKEIATFWGAETETYNPNEVKRNNLENVQRVSFASRNKPYVKPVIPEDQWPLDWFWKPSSYHQSGNRSIWDNSTISRARLDQISPVLTSTQDHINDLEKNTQILKDLETRGQFTDEDKAQLAQMKLKGVPKSEAFWRLMEQKRYQIGARNQKYENTPEKMKLIYSPSEVQKYLDEKPPTPEAEKYIKDRLDSGISKEDVKYDLFTKHITRDLENSIYEKKGLVAKMDQKIKETIGAAGMEFVAWIPHLAAFILNATGSKYNPLNIPSNMITGGKFSEYAQEPANAINEATDKVVKQWETALWADTGEFSWKMDKSLIAGKTIAIIADLLLESHWLNNLSKIEGLAENSPRLAKILEGISSGTKPLAKGAKIWETAANYTRRLWESAIRNGLFSVGTHAITEWKSASLWQTALETGLWVVWEGVLGLAGQALEKTGAKLWVSGLFSSKASVKSVQNALKEEWMSAADVDETWINNWLKSHTKWGEKADMLNDIKKFTTKKSMNKVTEVMDWMSQWRPIIQDKTGDIEWSINKLINVVKKGKSSQDKILKWELDRMLKKVRAEGGLTSTEATEVKRLIAERLHPFKPRGIWEPQNLDDAALYHTIKNEIEDVGESLGIDVRGLNKEVTEANVIAKHLENSMIKDSWKDMLDDIKKWTWKQALVKGIQSQLWPFNKDDLNWYGWLWNIALWQAGSLFLKVPWFAIDKTIWKQTFKNWASRLLTKFTPAEKWAFQKFYEEGQAGKFNRTWSDFASTPEWASAEEKMVEAILQLGKENNIELSSGLNNTMIWPATGKKTLQGTNVPTGGNRMPTDVVLPGGESSVAEGTPFPAIYDNTITNKTSINGANPSREGTPQWGIQQGGESSQIGWQWNRGSTQMQWMQDNQWLSQSGWGEYGDFWNWTWNNSIGLPNIVNPSPGKSLWAAFDIWFTLKKWIIDKPFWIKEMLREFEKLTPVEKNISIQSSEKLAKTIEADSVVKYVESITEEFGALPPVDLASIVKEVRTWGYSPEIQKYLIDSLPKEVKAAIQKINRQNSPSGDWLEETAKKNSKMEAAAPEIPVETPTKKSLPMAEKKEVKYGKIVENDLVKEARKYKSADSIKDIMSSGENHHTWYNYSETLVPNIEKTRNSIDKFYDDIKSAFSNSEYNVKHYEANTGSRYITIEEPNWNSIYQFRFADHSKPVFWKVKKSENSWIKTFRKWIDKQISEIKKLFWDTKYKNITYFDEIKWKKQYTDDFWNIKKIPENIKKIAKKKYSDIGVQIDIMSDGYPVLKLNTKKEVDLLMPKIKNLLEKQAGENSIQYLNTYVREILWKDVHFITLPNILTFKK